MMQRDFAIRRRAILGVVILLVLADVALAAYSWQLASTPHTPQQQLALEMRQHDLLKADIKRAQDIRDGMPAIQKDCDQFEQSLFPATTGYSSVTAELGDTAKKAGIQLTDLNFKQTDIANRGLKEVLMNANVSGDYKHVIQFLNGVQRSKNLYEVDGLSLASENSAQTPTGIIKVTVHLKTYFRATS
jgi:type IV pilus assembly protein PilO